MDKNQIWNAVYRGSARMLFFSLQDAWRSATQLEPVPYSEFEKALAEGRIADVTISDRKITGRLKATDRPKTTLVATRVDPGVAARFETFNVPCTQVVENTLLRDLLSWVVPALMFVGLRFFSIRRFAERQGGMGGLMSIGKSRVKTAQIV